MHKINKVELRSLQLEDYTQLSQSFKRVYADKDVFWTRKQIETLIRIFPEGQVVTLGDDCVSKMRGSVFAVVDLDIAGAVLVHKEQHAGQRDSQTGQNSEHYFQKFHGRPSLTAQTARRGMRLRVRLVVV